MKLSIQTKLLVMCIVLVLLTTMGISATYYILTKQDKHRESQQRVHIAFDIILDDLTNQARLYATRFDEFLKHDIRLSGVGLFYAQDQKQIGATQFMISSLAKMTDELKNFGSLIAADRLSFYGFDKRLLAVYERHGNQETIGGYVLSGTAQDTYLPMDDFSKLSAMHYQNEPIPDMPLPPGVVASYPGEIPDTISTSLTSEAQKLGLKIIAPVLNENKKVGVLVGEMFFTQSMADRYAALSETAVNFFVGNQWSFGTLSVQKQLEPDTLNQMTACEQIHSQTDVLSVIFDKQKYYQGRCAFKNPQGAIGALSISLSQEIEKQAINKILTAVLTISGITMGIAFGLSLIVSRKTINSIHNIVSVIGAAAEGDLRKTTTTMTRDEIGMLAIKLNQMIAQLRTISKKVQDAAYAVNGTADTILQQMNALIRHMEQQLTSVDTTTESVETINHFIDTVAQNTTDLLSVAAQILSSIQEMRASIEEVTTSTGSLTTNLYLISSSVDQVNQSVKQISEHAGHLVEAAQRTGTEIHHIDQSLRDVSQNADQTQQLAEETMDAATSGQASVEASIQGMSDLKVVVSQTAQIIQEVNSWGERVSSILDIVDDITEQTSLLALNAAIISAQAGEHGRGFAVVAEEIKELATRTKASTKEIGTLIHELQGKTADGVKKTAEGIAKADQGVQLATAVKDALNTILERATHSSNRATDTVQVIQQTVDSSRIISASMQSVTEMVSHIRTSLQKQEQDIEPVVVAVENLSGMAAQVNRANAEQTKAAGQIAESMEHVTEEFSGISNQTEELKQNSHQIVTAMHTIESTTAQILQNATSISGETVKNLLHESDVLQQIINVFKISEDVT